MSQTSQVNRDRLTGNFSRDEEPLSQSAKMSAWIVRVLAAEATKSLLLLLLLLVAVGEKDSQIR